MHDSSLDLMDRLRAEYIKKKSFVLDVGGADVNGSYRALFRGHKFKSLDFHDADIVVTGYDWPIADETFDVVISGQALEHDPRFWLTMQNIARVLKPGGIVILIVPSAGAVHRHPVDCWRFLPDSMRALADMVGFELLQTHWEKEGSWRDLAGVFRKPAAPTEENENG